MIGAITKVSTAGQIHYLSRGQVRSYYADNTVEGGSRIVGTGGEALGLPNDQEMTGESFERLAGGFHPSTGEKLLKAAGKNHRAGFDITLSDPKWASLVYAFNDGKMKDDLLAAKRDAVEAVQREVQRLAYPKNKARRGEEIQLFAAEFLHDDNREGLPQLHSHLFQLNLCRFKDGTWGAIETSAVMAHKAFLGQIYQNVLTQEMRKRGHDVGFERRESLDEKTKTPFLVSDFNLDLSETQMEPWNERRNQVLASLAADGKEYSAFSAARAAAKTRAEKDHDRSKELRDAEWKKIRKDAHIDDLHFTDERLAKNIQNHADLLSPQDAFMREVEWINEEAGKGLKRGLVREADIAAAVARSFPMEPPENLKKHIDSAFAFLTRKFEGEEYPTLLELPKEWVPPGGRIFSTGKNIQREVALIENLTKLAVGNGRSISTDELSGIVAAYQKKVGFELSENQLGAVDYIACESGLIANIEGVAGAGKTTLIEAAKGGLEAAGYRVIGATPTGKAAGELEGSLGQGNVQTIHSMLARIEAGKLSLDDRTAIVVDEAGMVDVPCFHAIVSQALKAGSKLIFVGDRKQFQAVGIGGGFDAAIRAAGNVFEVFENRRQDKAKTVGKNVGEAARNGDTEEVVNLLKKDKALSIVNDEDEAISKLAKDYANDGIELMQKLSTAETNETVDRINREIRRNLIKNRTIGSGVAVDVQSKRDGPTKRIELAVGEKIMFLENANKISEIRNKKTGRIEKPTNGQAAIVRGITKTARGIIIEAEYTSGGIQKQVRWNLSDYNKIAHGYCHSIHKSQGATTSRNYVLLEGSGVADAGSAYVALTRHKVGANAYTTQENLDAWTERAAKHADCRLVSEQIGLLPDWKEEWAARAGEVRVLRSRADNHISIQPHRPLPSAVRQVMTPDLEEVHQKALEALVAAKMAAKGTGRCGTERAISAAKTRNVLPEKTTVRQLDNSRTTQPRPVRKQQQGQGLFR
jgi:conjugative relaxase-like TrwC/TraI family protein